jgi:hypothetical protein
LQAALAILKSGDERLRWQVVKGHRSLLAAAQSVKPVVAMMEIYTAASSEARISFIQKYGIELALDDVVAADKARCEPKLVV